jgi:hypothetical protein
MVGMLFKEGLNLSAVLVQLELQSVEQLGQTEGQQAFSRGHRRRAAELAGVTAFECGGTLNNVTNTFAGSVTVGTNGLFTSLILSAEPI